MEEAINEQGQEVLVVKGPFQIADAKNANGRVYSSKLWNNVFSDKTTVGSIKERGMVGMLGHPADGKPDPNLVSHVITKNWLGKDKVVYGEAEILDTPSGKIVQELFRKNIRIGISSRGDGDVKETDKGEMVDEAYSLLGYDFVLNPSVNIAFPKAVESVDETSARSLLEGMESVVRGGKATDKDCEYYKSKLEVIASCMPTLQKPCSTLTEEIGNVLSPRRIEEETMEKKVEMTTGAGVGGLVSPLTNTSDAQFEALTAKALALEAHVSEWANRYSDQTKELEAAEKLIEELRVQLLAAQKVGEQTESDTTGKMEDLQKNYDAAESLVEELKNRYDAAEKLLSETIQRLRSYGDVAIRIEAAERLIEALIDEIGEGRVSEHIDAILANDPAAELIKPVLSECKDVESVNSKLEEIRAIQKNTKGYGRGLPPVGLRTVVESTREDDEKGRPVVTEESPQKSVCNKIVAATNRPVGVQR